MKTLAERLVWARNKKDLSQEALADLAGVSQSTIGNLEAGIRQSARKLPQIAFVLGVNALWLAEGKGKPFTDASTPSLVAEVPHHLVDPEEISLLVRLFGESTVSGRGMILDSARSAPKASITAKRKTTGN